MNPKILLVDDDPGLREVVAEILSMSGYQVIEAGSGHEAERLLSAGTRVDLILSDHNMPDGNGKELLEFVRKADPKSPPFLIITGQSATSAEELFRLGAQGCLYKPFKLEVLIGEIQKHLPPPSASGG